MFALRTETAGWPSGVNGNTLHAVIEHSHKLAVESHPHALAEILGRHGVEGFAHSDVTISRNSPLSLFIVREALVR